jgi:hypothetical protein
MVCSSARFSSLSTSVRERIGMNAEPYREHQKHHTVHYIFGLTDEVLPHLVSKKQFENVTDHE